MTRTSDRRPVCDLRRRERRCADRHQGSEARTSIGPHPAIKSAAVMRRRHGGWTSARGRRTGSMSRSKRGPRTATRAATDAGPLITDDSGDCHFHVVGVADRDVAQRPFRVNPVVFEEPSPTLAPDELQASASTP